MSARSNRTYERLIKPPLSPPGWVFGPVWLILYSMMGIAFFRVLTSGTGLVGVWPAIGLFAAQLALNFLWPYLYFTKEQRGAAFVEIWLLWGMIIWCAWEFYIIDKTAGWFMIPYLIWVSFAVYLNGATWYLNRP